MHLLEARCQPDGYCSILFATRLPQAPDHTAAAMSSGVVPQHPLAPSGPEYASGVPADDVALSSAVAARSLFADAMSDSPGTDDLEWLRTLPKLLSSLWKSLGHRCIMRVQALGDNSGARLRAWLSCPARMLDVPLGLHIFKQARPPAPASAPPAQHRRLGPEISP